MALGKALLKLNKMGSAEEKELISTTPKKKSNFVGAMGNFSVQYNMTVLSVALAFMKSHSDEVVESDDLADYPEPVWASKTLLAMVFVGAILGMFSMGYVGDVLGRRTGMLVTLSFVVVGALSSAFLSWGDVETVYGVITFCRFLIGFGVGGIYPMAAATAAESSSSGDDEAERVGWAFFWQIPGMCAPYAIAFFLQMLPHDIAGLTSIQFRILLALGALPAAIVWWATYSSSSGGGASSASSSSGSGSAGSVAASDAHKEKKNPLREAMDHPAYLWTLLGTGGTWFLYDIAYYGTAIFTPAILKSIFGTEDTLGDICWQSLAVASMGIPGIWAGIWTIKRYGGRLLNIWGFLLMASLYAAIAIAYQMDHTGLSNVKFTIFCLMTFAFNWGPNLATYVVPAMAYPPHVRTTFHGLSAASGKMGAVVGTVIFSVLDVKDPAVLIGIMWFLVVVSFAGAVVTWLFVPDVGRTGQASASSTGDVRIAQHHGGRPTKNSARGTSNGDHLDHDQDDELHETTKLV